MAYGFFRYDFQGLDARGNPIYAAEKITPLEKPNGMKNVARVWYRSETDTLVAAEEGENEEGRSDMRHIGRVFVCKDYLAGNRIAVTFRSGAGAKRPAWRGGGLRFHRRMERPWPRLDQSPFRRAPVGVLDLGPASAESRTPGGSTSSPGSAPINGKMASTSCSSRKTLRRRSSSIAGGRDIMKGVLWDADELSAHLDPTPLFDYDGCMCSAKLPAQMFVARGLEDDEAMAYATTVERHKTREVGVGDQIVGGDNPIWVQSMTTTNTFDVEETLAQIHRLEEAGCEIVRVTIPKKEDVEAVKLIRDRIKIPLIADIHYDYRMALAVPRRGHTVRAGRPSTRSGSIPAISAAKSDSRRSSARRATRESRCESGSTRAASRKT